MSSSVKGFDRFIWTLFCVYVFMLPFENITKVIWQIESPYRPYRVLALIIGLLIVISRKPNKLKFYNNDLKLLWVYLFGLIPSVIAWSKDLLLAESFWLTSLQLFIVLWIFLLIKNLELEWKHLLKIMTIYVFGVLINCIYMSYIFLTSDISRQSGFMDNANFAAFANNIAFSYFIYSFYKSNEKLFSLNRLFYLLASLIVLFGLFITGSRSSFLALVVCILWIFFSELNTRKVITNLLFLVVPIVLFFQVINLDRFLNVVPLWSRFVSLNDKEDARSVLWRKGFIAFKDSDFIGIGIEQFKNPQNYSKYVHKSDNITVANQQGLVIHNDFLTVLFEYGIISFVFFISFYYFIFIKLFSSTINLHPMWILLKILFWNSVILSMFTSSFQSHSMWFALILLTFGCILLSRQQPQIQMEELNNLY